MRRTVLLVFALVFALPGLLTGCLCCAGGAEGELTVAAGLGCCSRDAPPRCPREDGNSKCSCPEVKDRRPSTPAVTATPNHTALLGDSPARLILPTSHRHKVKPRFMPILRTLNDLLAILNTYLL